MVEIDLMAALERIGYYEAGEGDKEEILSIVINEDLERLALALEEYARSGAQREMSFLEWIRGGQKWQRIEKQAKKGVKNELEHSNNASGE